MQILGHNVSTQIQRNQRQSYLEPVLLNYFERLFSGNTGFQKILRVPGGNAFGSVMKGQTLQNGILEIRHLALKAAFDNSFIE